MTVWAILSDVHGRGDRLSRVLADAEAQGASRILALGDIAAPGAIETLQDVDAVCVFGNWEASGLRGLPGRPRSFVSRWRAQWRGDSFWAAHASPVWPDGLAVAGVVDYLRTRDLHWTSLFPSLQRSEDARWAALTEIHAAGIPVFLHGHTHAQEAWRWVPDEALQPATGPVLEVAPGERWVIGVGSVGDPHDGQGACYSLFDDEHLRAEWRRV